MLFRIAILGIAILGVAEQAARSKFTRFARSPLCHKPSAVALGSLAQRAASRSRQEFAARRHFPRRRQHRRIQQFVRSHQRWAVSSHATRAVARIRPTTPEEALAGTTHLAGGQQHWEGT